MTRLNKRRTVNYVCALLMAAMLLMQFLPFWSYNGETASVNDYVWFSKNYTWLEGYFKAELGSNATGINGITGAPALMFIFCAIGIVLTLVLPKSIVTVIPAIGCGISAIYGYVFVPELRLGALWWLHLILSILIMAAGIYAVIIGREKEETVNKAVKDKDIYERIAEIRELGNVNPKKRTEELDRDFNKLLNHIDDEAVECRIAAAEELAKTSREVAFTQVSRRLDTETDEKAVRTMHNTLKNIRNNQKKEREEQR